MMPADWPSNKSCTRPRLAIDSKKSMGRDAKKIILQRIG